IGARPEPGHAPVDVVLYGFGRIGRLMARILIDKTDGGESLRLRAVVVRKGSAPDDLVKRASLLRR
ncbi:MAG TPA: glyceraldehyde-3-phosphate dehydrogenase, partial [Haliea salexigens]|nr:glyceraldehyde-3-phosphate dehydrogenase [Haliea salexigens]